MRCSPAVGSSDMILIMWDDMRYRVVDHIVKNYSISIEISYPNDINNTNWWLTAVYGLAKRENIGDFWVELDEIKSIYLPRWIMGRDFNVVKWQSESTPKILAASSMKKFNAFTMGCDFIYVPSDYRPISLTTALYKKGSK